MSESSGDERLEARLRQAKRTGGSAQRRKERGRRARRDSDDGADLDDFIDDDVVDDGDGHSSDAHIATRNARVARSV